MKFAKRILVAVLAIALLTSMFALSSVAEEDREYDYRLGSITMAEQILEYYALDDYLADNYEDGTWNEDILNITKASRYVPTYGIAADPLNPDNMVLTSSLPRNRTAVGYKLESAPGELLTDKLIVSARVYFDESATNGLNFKLNAGLQSEIDPSSRYFDIVKIDMKTGALTYSGWDDETQIMEADKYTYADFTAVTGVWYDILITFNAEADYYNLIIKNVPDDESEAEVLVNTGNVEIKGATGMAGFNLSVAHTANSAASFSFDNIEIYEGTTTRSPSYKSENTKIHVEDLVEFYAAETTDYATKLRIADTLFELYSTYSVDISYENTVDSISKMYETLAAEFIARAGAIDDTLNYAGRAAWIEKIEKYELKLPQNADLATTPGLTPELIEDIIECRNALTAEKASVAIVKEHSENYIDFMTNVYDADNKNYVQMQVWVAELNDEYTEDNTAFAGFDTVKYPYQTRFYSEFDPTYEGVPELVKEAEAFVAKFNEINANINAFLTHVDSIELSASFGARYTAYVHAFEVYNNGVIHPAVDNDSHAELKNRIAYYKRTEPSILSKKAECELFISLVEQAQIASYYTVFVEKLDLAVAAFKDIAIDYENITESVEIYNELRLTRAAIEADANAYIAAVDAIADAEDDFYAKKEAVALAIELKDAGNVLGYPGVKEANVALSAAEADVNFREFSSTTLISLVAEIESLDSIEKRRELLRLAYNANENAEDTYAGVAEAKAAFEVEMERFTADVKAANDAIVSVTDVAAAIVSAVNGVAIYN